MATMNERIEQLKEMAAETWCLMYLFREHYGADSVEYNREAARACAYSKALELITGRAWYYNSCADEMRVCD